MTIKQIILLFFNSFMFYDLFSIFMKRLDFLN